MKPPVIRKSRTDFRSHRDERGVTMVLVAVAMIAIIAMAALSIDVITLYLAREEAQRSADAAALAAARVISISGMTGDPGNTTASWGPICGGPTSAATQSAIAVARQSAVGGTNDSTVSVSVNYSAGTSTPVADCSSLSAGSQFGVNPLVTVQITRAGLPSFFSRIWGSTGHSVSATSVAEVFNPSASDLGGGTGTPVQPRCVKPWVVPNLDPWNPNPVGAHCGQPTQPACQPLVNVTNGAIIHSGTSLSGAGTGGIIGETFWLMPDCINNPTRCNLLLSPPQANATGTVFAAPYDRNLLYVPNQVVDETQVMAIPTCSQADPYEKAIGGCDAPTNYQCGVPIANRVDLTVNPSAPTTTGVQCLIHQTDTGNVNSSSGQDSLNPFATPSSFPFQMLAGSDNPLVLKAGLPNSNPISSSNSIVSLPIYDNGPGTATINSNTTTNVTFVGFLQVFVNAVDANGNIKVTVLNVAGCGNGTNPVGNPVAGTSPVPIRLVTPP
jgi:Flp pilus assembly protein TadG